MPYSILSAICLSCLLLVATKVVSQQFSDDYNTAISPHKAFNALSLKLGRLHSQLTQQKITYLSKISRSEAKLIKKIKQRNLSVHGDDISHNTQNDYLQFISSSGDQQTSTSLSKIVYSPHLDSMRVALLFLNESGYIDNERIASQLQLMNSFQSELNQTKAIQAFLNQRRSMLVKKLEQLGLVKEIKQLHKQVEYYKQQVQNCKSLWEQPGKLEKKLLQKISTINSFKAFFNEHAQLAALFKLPTATSLPVDEMQGLQNRAVIEKSLHTVLPRDLAANSSPSAGQYIGLGKQQLKQLKEKISNRTLKQADNTLPDFKPQSVRTKSFLKRLEFGSNVQSVRATNWFPTTTDIGLSLGYKLSDKSTIGVGSSYKIGWGTLQHIKITSQGVSLRSFVDMKIKGSFHAAGGFEYNYQQPFMGLSTLKMPTGWTSSGLLGVSKYLSLRSRFFGKTSVQLLWDFLSYQQVPQTQPLLFRIGYTLK